ncbi:MAG: hypothetical protein LBG89_00755 [Rickettsiales bacterium]|jgi:hypothetical protein|nr:hypothetical protein [Rickettsiales bacterium]
MNKFVFAIFVALVFCAHSVGASTTSSRGADARPDATGGVKTAVENNRAGQGVKNQQAKESRDLAARKAVALNRNAALSRSASARSATANNQKLSPRGPAAGSRPNPVNASRSARNNSPANQSRAANVRGQVGKIAAPVAVASHRLGRAAEALGSDYTACRDQYGACMDQFCAAASETYKKCICSDKYLDLAAQREALESAENALQDFGALNLNMIQMTANEVNAVTSATEGERAAREDTSANAQKLNDILGGLGGGKSGPNNKSRFDLGGQSSFNLDVDDIWGGGATEGVVGDNVRGRALFTAVNGQCQQMTRDACKGSNVAMVVSAYSLTIDSDCQKFQAAVDKMRQAVKDKIRAANLAMMNERLSDFENRNSQTAVDCLQNVLKDFQTDAVCGADWVKCLDFTGKFIDQKGEPIYNPDFADDQKGLTSLLSFGSGSQTILEANKSTRFVGFLNEKRVFAGDSLKRCEQENANDVVWIEALNRALLEIVQAQARKVEDVKDNCLTKLVECNVKNAGEMGKITGTSGDDTGTKAGSLASIEACRDIQRSCESVYGSDALEALLADRQHALQIEYCEKERGGYWFPEGSVDGKCIITKADCEKAGLYWTDQEGNLNEFQKNAKANAKNFCVSFEYYCGNFEASEPLAPAERNPSQGVICKAPTRDQCLRNNFPWVQEKCIRNKFDCDSAGEGIIWYKGRCFNNPDEASKQICIDLGGNVAAGLCNIPVTHKK